MSNMTYLAEFLGTFVFLSIILRSGGDKYVVVLGLLAAILFVGVMSSMGGEFNPAVTFMNFMSKKLDAKTACGHVVAQLLGAYAAIQFVQLR